MRRAAASTVSAATIHHGRTPWLSAGVRSRTEQILVVSLLAIMAAVCLQVVRNESVTFDERAHIPAGLSYLQQRDGRLNIEHPPLIKMLAALPLAFDGVRLPYDESSWEAHQDFDFGDASIRSWGDGAAGNILLARIPMILLTAALAVQVFFMARRLGGRAGGFLSLLVFITAPFFLAYGPLVLTDIGVAFFALQTVWTFASLWQSPTPARSALLALSLAGALLSKYSSGLIIPICIGLALFYWKRSPGSAHTRRAALLSLGALVSAAVIVYAVCAIAYWNTDTVSLLHFKYAKRPINAVRIAADVLGGHPWLERLSFPPILYFLGVGATLRGMSRATYLLGKIYDGGTWTYFPALFGFKMTPGFLCLVILLLAVMVWNVAITSAPTRRKTWGDSGQKPNHDAGYHAKALIALCVTFGVAAIASPLNIGIRHISIPIASLTILVGLVPAAIASLPHHRMRLALNGIAVAAVASCVWSSAVTYPHYLSYFNFLAGDRPKFEIAVDSNLDWGQTLIPLRNFMASHGVNDIFIDSSGSTPDVYVPGARAFNCERGVPDSAEWVAVGASRFFSEPDLSFDSAKPVGHCLDLFNHASWSEAGGALYIFHIPSKSSGADRLPPNRQARTDSVDVLSSGKVSR
ncbi:MAG TPA: glycosyltransferase family 39 protein [Terriglobia bacterium]|nr:glycosyltransferase family 39 protein [Terriglobia bacterium]